MDIVIKDDEACIVNLEGSLWDYDENEILSSCTQQISTKLRRIILNIENMDFMNSSAAGMLVRLHVMAKRQGIAMHAFGLSQHYLDVFGVTRLSEAICIHNSEAEALSTSGTAIAGQPALEGQSKIKPRDEGCWARPVSRLKVLQMPPQARNINVAGRRLSGPVQGFGQLWQKTYRLKLSDSKIRPDESIRLLKENFPAFQPAYNHFYPTAAGIQPGEIVLIDSSTPGGPVSTGVMVLYTDETSFSFITPQGHPESGWVTFTAFKEDDTTVVQIQGIARASDPVYELAFRLAGSKMQVRIWTHLLESLAKHLEVKPNVRVQALRLDATMQWTQMWNVWHNAQIRTLIYTMMTPLRWIWKRMRP